MEKLREEGSPDLALAGEELLQAEPRELWTRDTGTKGTSYWGLKLPFWASMGAMDHMHIVRTQDPHQVWLARLEEWEWWFHTTDRMPRRITIPHPTLVTWNSDAAQDRTCTARAVVRSGHRTTARAVKNFFVPFHPSFPTVHGRGPPSHPGT